MSLEVCACGKQFLTEADPYVIIPIENYTINCGCYLTKKLQKEKDMAVRVLKKLNRDISNGEHVDSSWIKDTIELNAR